jgi:hypothetical protein
VFFSRYAALVAGSLVLSAASAYAGPIYTFTTSEGSQLSNVGTITLTQIDETTVDVLVDLIDTTLPNPQYGFVNSGQKTPFTFTIAGTETGVSATFIQPASGQFCPDNATCPPTAFQLLSLNTSNEPNKPYGIFGIGIDSSAQNGTAGAYFGDLEFKLTRTSGLSTDHFITNSAISPKNNVYFAADLTNGSITGAQAWEIRTTPKSNDPTDVPEPTSLVLLGSALLGLGFIGRLRKSTT